MAAGDCRRVNRPHMIAAFRVALPELYHGRLLCSTFRDDRAIDDSADGAA